MAGPLGLVGKQDAGHCEYLNSVSGFWVLGMWAHAKILGGGDFSMSKYVPGNSVGGISSQSLSGQEGGLVYPYVYPKLGLEVCSFHSFIPSAAR